MNTHFDREAYLARVGLLEWPAPTLDGLRTLHHAQFHRIAFENFDIQLGRGIRLDPSASFEKLVRHRRGGYCFELNGLLLRALRETGFEARPLLARVHLSTPPSGRTHQVSLVECEGRRWIVDAGFGAGGPSLPLPFVMHEVQGERFRLVPSEPWGTMLQTREDGAWKDSYSFDSSLVTDADIEVGNHFTSTSVHSHFVTSRVASLPVDSGRVSLRNFTLTRIEGSQRTETKVAEGAEYLRVLESEFGIELDAAYEELRPISAD